MWDVVSTGTAVAAVYALAGVLMLPFVALFSRYEVRGSNWMVAIMATAFVTAEAYTVSLLVEGPDATLAWYYVFAVAISLSALSFLGFTLVWTGREPWVTPRNVLVLGVVHVAVPVAGLAALGVGRTEFHSLVWADPGTVPVGGLTAMDRTPGPLGILWRLVPTGAVVVMLVLLTEFTIRPEQRLYRKRNGLLLAAPTLVTALSLGAQAASAPVEVTPVLYLLTGGIFAVAVGRYGHFDVVPLATDSIVEEIDAGVLVYDTAGRVLDSNSRAEDVLGTDAEAGDGVVEMLAAAPAVTDLVDEGTDLATLEARLDGAQFGVDDAGFGGGGDERHRQYAASVSEIAGTTGGTVGRALLLFDVTDRYRRERQLRRKNEQLGRKNEQLERLADVVSHDMRGPLSSADTLLTLLRKDLSDPDPAVEQSLDDLEGVHERLDEFAEHLPRLARESTGVETPVECDLGETAEAAWRVIETGPVELRVEGTTRLAGDPQRLQRVFENLFRNAIDHGSLGDDLRAVDGGERNDGEGLANGGEAGGTTAASGGESLATATETVTRVEVGTFKRGVYVEDDGPGIAPEQREVVFEYGTSGGDGSGFGLAIVRTIVEAHGWSIDVTDGALGGARFEIYTDDGTTRSVDA